MPRGKLYDDEDLDYEEDWDDDYGDGYDDYDDVPAKAPAKVTNNAANKKASSASATASSAKTTPAAAAGASRMARYLCDPPPLMPSGKPQPGVKKEPLAQVKQQATYPIAPTPTQGVNKGIQPGIAQATQPNNASPAFDFNTPSPDAVAIAARNKETAGPSSTVSSSTSKPSGSGAKVITLAPSKAMLAANKAIKEQQAAASSRASLDQGTSSSEQGTVTSQLGGLSIDGAAKENAISNVAGRRRMSEYQMEQGLARECEAVGSTSQSGDRQALHLVVLGHVDAGKSTLMGRLLAELGRVSQKDVHRNQRDAAAAGKSSFSWAWLLDERPEERARGVTIDVATTRFTTKRFNVTLLDAPGHKDFIPNMISGAAQADAALLLVDASPGGFEAGFQGSGAVGADYGQTREHAQLARSLGVEQLAVVISKLDLAGYDQARYDSIKSQLAPFLASCGFKESGIQWLPAVGPEGINLVRPPPASCGLSSWWKGPCLVEAIDKFVARERLIGKPARIPISDVFKNKAGMTVVGGKLESGAVKPGSKLVIVPGGEQVTVKSLETDGQSCTLARAGDSIEVSLIGQNLDVSHLAAGFVLSHPDFPTPCVKKFEMRVLVLDVPVPLLKGQSITIHAHLAREAGVISGLLSSISSKTGEVIKAKPRCLAKGQSGIVEITASRGICLEEYSDLKALGRVTLRDGGRTLAVGVVTKLLE